MNENDQPIQLDDRQHVRKRPGMYFGGTGRDALHNIVWEILDNPLHQARKGFCNRIEVTLSDDNLISIHDNGPGIPIKLYEDTGRSMLEIILTKPGGRHLEGDQLTGGLDGAGIGAVNAVSAEMKASVKREGFLWEQQYKEGLPQSQLERVRPLTPVEEAGTTLTFKPDYTVFERNGFDANLLQQRLREKAFLFPGLNLVLRDQRSINSGSKVEFYYPDGTAAYVRHLNRDYPALHAPIRVMKTVELERDHKPLGYNADIEVALQYADTQSTIILGYVNALEMEEGGSHLDGFLLGLDLAMNHFGPHLGIFKVHGHFARTDLTAGLAAVINVWHPQPSFGFAIRGENFSTELENFNTELVSAVSDVVFEMFEELTAMQPDEMRRIVEKCLKNKALRLNRQFGT